MWRAIYKGVYPGGPGLKVARAEKHLTDLETVLRDFLDTRPYRAVPEYYREGDTQVIRYRARVRADTPVVSGPIIGDILHNLRSALDGVVYLIASVFGASRRELEYTQFPIHLDRRSYLCGEQNKPPGRTRIRSLPPTVRAIVTRCQPYRAGDHASIHPLWLLNSLVNRDKHRHVHVGGAYIREIVLVPTAFTNAELVKRHVEEPGPFKPDAVLAEFRLRITGPNANLRMDEQFPFDIAFENAGAATGLLVIPTLRRLLEYVDVVEAILFRFAENEALKGRAPSAPLPTHWEPPIG